MKLLLPDVVHNLGPNDRSPAAPGPPAKGEPLGSPIASKYLLLPRFIPESNEEISCLICCDGGTLFTAWVPFYHVSITSPRDVVAKTLNKNTPCSFILTGVL
jgi:hypothetical protein